MHLTHITQTKWVIFQYIKSQKKKRGYITCQGFAYMSIFVLPYKNHQNFLIYAKYYI
jgi:hypothetical protein